MFENKKTHFGIYYTRYIMSWVRAGGTIPMRGPITDFVNWLRSEELTDEEIQEIKFLATNGKMELEYKAEKFLENV